MEQKRELFSNLEKCPKCGKVMRDVFELKQDEKNQFKLFVKGIEISSKKFKELKRIYCYQNICLAKIQKTEPFIDNKL